MGKRPRTPATMAVARSGVDFTVHEYAHDPSRTDFGDESVEQLGIPASRVLKTLVVHAPELPAREAFALAIVPVAARLDLHAVGTALGTKRVVMADPDRAAQRTGYVPGGISPLGTRSPMPTLIDSSVEGCGTVVVSGGRRGLSIELTPGDLAALTDARFAPIAAGDG